MTRVYMVRHGRAAAGWNVDPDPGLDDLGRSQSLAVASKLSSLGPLAVMSSPLLRCQQTAFPLATAWKQDVVIEPLVGEIPSPVDYTLENIEANGYAKQWQVHGRKWQNAQVLITSTIAMQ